MVRLSSLVLLFFLSLTGASFAEVMIAVVGPMSGKYATFGEQIRIGAQGAVDELNSAGGVLGENLMLEIADDSCDPDTATAVANQMAGKGVIFVVGHFCSRASVAASKVYARQRIVQISPFSPNPQFTDRRPDPTGGTYRVFGRFEEQGDTAGSYLAREHGQARIAVIHDGSAYGKGLADKTKIAMEAAGKNAEFYSAYESGQTDYNDLAARLNAMDIQVLFVGGYHDDAALIVREIRDRGMATQIVAGDALLTELYWKRVGSAGEGTLVTFSPDPRKNRQASHVVEQFRDAGVEPEGYVLYAYGAVQAWAQAAEVAGRFDFEAVVSVLNLGTFSTVLGDLTFDSKGNSTLPGYVFYVWRNGKYDYALPPEPSDSP